MNFEIKRTTDDVQNPMVEWVLTKKGGVEVARSPRAYNDEEECRRVIAEVKPSLKGAQFAKVKAIS